MEKDAGQDQQATKRKGKKGAGRGGPYLNGRRWWGNFQSFADVGGRREPLVPKGAKVATDDYQVALKLYVARVAELEAWRKAGLTGQQGAMSPSAYAQAWLDHLATQRLADGRRLHGKASLEKRHYGVFTCLGMPALRKVEHLADINRTHMTQMIRELHATARTKAGEPFAVSTIRNHVMWLSAMLSRAEFDGIISANPLRKHPDIPPLVRGSALKPNAYLTRDEVRRLLENILPTPRNPYAIEQAYVLYYTGCRRDEMLGLLVEDVDFSAKRVWIREHAHRSIKGSMPRRSVTLWPKLEYVLAAYLERNPRPEGQLLFPSVVTGHKGTLEEQMMGALRKTLTSAARRAGIAKKLGHHISRHSYVTARRSMMDRDVLGAPVPVRDEVIAREVGHATVELIESTYGHVAAQAVSDVILDYGETLPDAQARRERSRREHSQAVRAGWASRRQRATDVARLETAQRSRRRAKSTETEMAAD